MALGKGDKVRTTTGLEGEVVVVDADKMTAKVRIKGMIETVSTEDLQKIETKNAPEENPD